MSAAIDSEAGTPAPAPAPAATPADAALTGGFADPGRQAAHAFRALLDAMARPGRVVALEGASPPAGISAAAGAALLTLADPDAPVWLPPRLRGGPVADWLRFHASAPLAEDPGGAVFALGRWAELQPLDAWPVGTPEFPDRSATLIVELDALDGPELALEGPGIAGTARLGLGPEGPAIAAARAPFAALFPQGLDLILCAGGSAAALPRTTRVREG